MEKLTKAIRIGTVAPIMACLMLTVIYISEPQVYSESSNFVFAILFLTVLPILAYPLQKYIPGYKDKGREGQRSLAMIFAVCGYIIGCVTNLFLSAPLEMWMIYLEYLISGIGIMLFNKLFHFNASGHACGVVGPLALLVVFGIPALLPGLILFSLVWWASLVMKRHTPAQLAGGTVIPLATIVILNLLFM